jgi:hypothetical protein
VGIDPLTGFSSGHLIIVLRYVQFVMKVVLYGFILTLGMQGWIKLRGMDDRNSMGEDNRRSVK